MSGNGSNDSPVPPGFRLLGPSTRVVTLTSGEKVAFSRESLEGAVEQASSGFIPQAVEHLNYLPPIGRIAEATLVEVDGDAFLATRETPLAPGWANDLVLPRAPEDAAVESAADSAFDVTVATEPRNFTSDDINAIRRDATFPLGDIALHSELPPIIWSFVITGAAVGFFAAKSFTQAFFSKLGDETGEAFVSWLRRAGSRVKAGHREQIAEFRFLLDNGVTVLAFCPFSPHVDTSIGELQSSLNRLCDVAVFVGQASGGRVPTELRQAAFMWSEDQWRLAWWASDEGSFVTPWFAENAPDPARFLGYRSPLLRLFEPYMPHLPGASAEHVSDEAPDINGPQG